MKLFIYAITPFLTSGIGIYGLYACWKFFSCAIFEKNYGDGLAWICIATCCYILMHVVYQIGKWVNS